MGPKIKAVRPSRHPYLSPGQSVDVSSYLSPRMGRNSTLAACAGRLPRFTGPNPSTFLDNALSDCQRSIPETGSPAWVGSSCFVKGREH